MILTSRSGEKHIVVRLGEPERDVVVQMIELALENNSGNITKAARAVGLNRTCLLQRLRLWPELREIADRIGALRDEARIARGRKDE